MRQFNVFSPEIVVHCLVAKSWPTLCDPVDCSTPAHLPCSSPSPGVCPNSCPLSWWCYLIISSPATRGGLNSRVKIRFSLSLSWEEDRSWVVLCVVRFPNSGCPFFSAHYYLCRSHLTFTVKPYEDSGSSNQHKYCPGGCLLSRE